MLKPVAGADVATGGAEKEVVSGNEVVVVASEVVDEGGCVGMADVSLDIVNVKD